MAWRLQWEGAYGGWAIVDRTYLSWRLVLPSPLGDLDVKSSVARPRIPVIVYSRDEAQSIVDMLNRNQKEQP